MRLSRTLVALAAVATWSVPAAAQQGTLTGRVSDSETGQPLAQAQVEVRSLGGSTGGLSNAQGQFRVPAAPGSYTVVVTLLGYETTRVDGVEIRAGGTVTVDVRMTSTALALDPIVVTGTRGVEVRSSAAPAHVEVVQAEEVQERAATTPVDYVKGMPGVDAIQTGLTQSNTVARGFNNVFSGALLVLTDNRYARVPSLRLNAYNMIPTTPLDIDRVEMVLGPASALYGPNSANGVMHILTTSPIDHPGTTVSLAGGERSVFHGAFRQAFAFSEQAGFKVSGQYFRGNDFEYVDPAEVAAAAENPGDPRIGVRDNQAERFGGEARFDVRPWDDGEVVFSYGLNEIVSSIELTGIGAGQARDWRYQFGQVRLNKGRLFAQVFRNWSDSGNDGPTDTSGSYLLQTGNPIVDRSSVTGAQVQYGFLLGERLDVTVGGDLSRTNPVTEGTINGANEENDQTREIGGYVHGKYALSDMVDLVGAVRVDDHEHLADAVVSPRAGLVIKPQQGQTVRLTYNRAFSTPTSNNLFLDLVARSNPFGTGADIRTVGVPSTGFTFDQMCPGGMMNLCMFSPFVPGRSAAVAATGFWDPLVTALAAADPTFAPLAPALLGPGSQPGDPALASDLLRFNQELAATPGAFPYLPDTGPTAISRIKPTITTTFEVGYKGLIDQKLLLAADVYRSQIKDFVGPLRVETPTVHFSLASVSAYVQQRLGALVANGTITPAQLQTIIGTLAAVPLGTVAPDQRDSGDLILTYRNFGDVDLWGADLGFELLATELWSVSGSYSFVSEECFDFDTDASCASANDVALNAPTNKGSIGLRFDDQVSGFAVEGRVRYSDAFSMNSGVYIGDVESYTVFDLNAAYRVPGYAGFIVALTVNNVLDNDHQEFIGAPRIGRLGLLKLQYAF